MYADPITTVSWSHDSEQRPGQVQLDSDSGPVQFGPTQGLPIVNMMHKRSKTSLLLMNMMHNKHKLCYQ